MIAKDLVGPIELFVKFPTLQDYGVEKIFLLENANVDSSQRNIVFLVYSDKAVQVQSTTGRRPSIT